MTDFKFICKLCDHRIQTRTKYAGELIQCPVCEREIVIPQPPRSPEDPLPIAYPPGQAPPPKPSPAETALRPGLPLPPNDYAFGDVASPTPAAPPSTPPEPAAPPQPVVPKPRPPSAAPLREPSAASTASPSPPPATSPGSAQSPRHTQPPPGAFPGFPHPHTGPGLAPTSGAAPAQESVVQQPTPSPQVPKPEPPPSVSPPARPPDEGLSARTEPSAGPTSGGSPSNPAPAARPEVPPQPRVTGPSGGSGGAGRRSPFAPPAATAAKDEAEREGPHTGILMVAMNLLVLLVVMVVLWLPETRTPSAPVGVTPTPETVGRPLNLPPPPDERTSKVLTPEVIDQVRLVASGWLEALCQQDLLGAARWISPTAAVNEVTNRLAPLLPVAAGKTPADWSWGQPQETGNQRVRLLARPTEPEGPEIELLMSRSIVGWRIAALTWRSSVGQQSTNAAFRIEFEPPGP